MKHFRIICIFMILLVVSFGGCTNGIFTGYRDPNIISNSFGLNPNHNILEFINKPKGFKDKVTAFCMWNKFYDIFNIERSGFYLLAGADVSHRFYEPSVLPVIEHLTTLPSYRIMDVDSAADKQVFAVAKTYLMKNRQRVLYTSFYNTDGFEHAGKYGCYLKAAHNNDLLIKDLWNYFQSDDFYKDKTTLVLTTDHGRDIGDEAKEQLYQYQYAKSLAAFLELDYTNKCPIRQDREYYER